MTIEEAMATLESMGTAQNVKVYKRHGAGENLFGVSFANLEKLRKQIRTDHELACCLWGTGNTDARTLALMVADPAQMKPVLAAAWLRDISYPLLGDYLARLVARTSFALSCLQKWTKLKGEQPRCVGYSLVCAMLKDAPEQLTDDLCRELLTRIEAELQSSPNRARHSMNMALCAIGIAREALRDESLAAARRIGPVEVDHGETGCTTPPAEGYILKATQRVTKAGKKASLRRRS